MTQTDNNTKPPSTSSEVLDRLLAHGLHSKSSQPSHESLRRASVLVLLSQDHQILLTRRTLHLKSHPGEVCFPGGKQDEADQGDDWTTALRETHEEVGLELQLVVPSSKTSTLPVLQKMCCLSTLESINHLCVTSMVGYVDQTAKELSQQIKINPSEVECYFWVPLSYFAATRPVQEYEISWSGEIFIFRKYLWTLHESVESQQLPVTGLTAHIAHQVSQIAASV